MQQQTDERPHPPDWAALANGGDADAIAPLLLSAFSQPSFQIQSRAVGQTLQIFLLGDRLPDAEVAIDTIQQTLAELTLPWQLVQVEGYILGAIAPVWSQTFGVIGLQPTLPLSSVQTPQPVAVRPPLRSSPSRKTVSKISRGSTSRPSQSLSYETIGVLMLGFVLAIPLSALGFLRVLFHGWLILVHEIGHALTYWLFGYPAVPSVNLLYGGGITLAMGRLWLLAWLILGGLGYLIYRCRRSSNALSWLLTIAVVYALLAFSPWHTRLISYMGHGAETLALIGCLYFAIGGYFCKLGGERVIYAMLGWFTWFESLRFAWGLLFDTAARARYIGGIGGVLDNDFVKLADSFEVGLGAIATFFLLVSAVAPVIAILLYRYEARWQNALWRK